MSELENATPGDEGRAGRGLPSPRLALASLSLAMLLASLGTSIANVALPALARSFDVPFQAVQWIVLAYLLATTTLIVSVGRLGDIIGRRRLLVVGLLLFAGASMIGGMAPVLWLLIAARAAQGLGAAIMMALALAFAGDLVPKAKLGGIMGLLGTMSAIGTALGPSLGGVLIAGFGWRAIFFVNVAPTLAALLLARRFLPVDHRATPPPRAAPFDALGTAVMALMLGAYALAMTIGRGSFGPLNVGLLVAAMAGLGLFAAVEARMQSPLIRLAMFREPGLGAGLAMSALVATVMMATLVVGPFYLARALGLGSASVGLTMSVGPLVAALTGFPAGRVVDGIGAVRLVVLGLSAMAAGCVLLAAIPARFGVPGYLAPVVIVTLGYALFQTANNTAVMKGAPQDRRGVVSGLLNLSRNLGLITGASVMGAVFAAAVGADDISAASPEKVTAGLRVTFVVAAALVVTALAVAVESERRANRPVAIDAPRPPRANELSSFPSSVPTNEP